MTPSIVDMVERTVQRTAYRERAEALSDAGRCIERAIAEGKTLTDAYEMVLELMGETADDLIAMSLLIEGEEVKQ